MIIRAVIIYKKHKKCIVISHTKLEQRQLLFFIVTHHSRSIKKLALLNIMDQKHTIIIIMYLLSMEGIAVYSVLYFCEIKVCTI